jgi:hypothetical protein
VPLQAEWYGDEGRDSDGHEDAGDDGEVLLDENPQRGIHGACSFRQLGDAPIMGRDAERILRMAPDAPRG